MNIATEQRKTLHWERTKNRWICAIMLLRNLFFVTAKTRHIWRSFRSLRSLSRLTTSSKRYNNYNRLSYSQGTDDIEKGVEQFNNNENENSSTGCKQNCELSGKQLLVRACLCALGLLIFVGCSILTYYMGWYFGFPAYLAAFAAILFATGKWRWLYVAVVTAPRDIRWAV